MKTKEAAIAQKAAPSILKALQNEKNIDLLPAVEPITNAFTTVSCKDQIAISEIGKAACPAFAAVSKEFFDALYKIINVSQEHNLKEMEKIIDAVFEDESTNLETKMKLLQTYRDHINACSNEQIEMFLRHSLKFARVISETVISVVLISKLSNISTEAIHQQGKNERSFNVLAKTILSSLHKR